MCRAMRVIAGKYRGHKLFVPRGRLIRPTPDMVRESIFNILGAKVSNSRVLDLFAGTGALGLEAISRGAREAVFADKRNTSLAAINRNIQTLSLAGQCRVLKIDLMRGLGRLKNEVEPFDLIFMDPPYTVNVVGEILDQLTESGLAAPQAQAVAEHDSKLDLTDSVEHWILTKQRRYGQTTISFFSTGLLNKNTLVD